MWNYIIDFNEEEWKLVIFVDVLFGIVVVVDVSWKSMDDIGIVVYLKGFEKLFWVVCDYDKFIKIFIFGLIIFKWILIFIERLDIEIRIFFLIFFVFNCIVGFIGRFDWKNYVVSMFVSY